MRWAVLLVLSAAICFAQPALPGCEPNTEVRKFFHEKISSTDTLKLKYSDRVARMHEVLNGLIAKYPSEIEPYNRLINFVHYDEPDAFPALQARFREQAAQQPDDPVALYVAGLALLDTDTSESIRLLKAARSKAPSFPWPNLKLAEIYSSGKTQSKQNSEEYLRSFLSVCPAPAYFLTEMSLSRLMSKVGDRALQVRAAEALRIRLAAETDPDFLRSYSTLWRLEFRLHPPQDHPALRRQVAQDIKRMETLNPKPDVYWMESLRDAYRESGADEAAITALDDRILRDYPYSQYVSTILFARWEKTHKEPEDPADPAWAAYNRALMEAYKGWIQDYPQVVDLARYDWFRVIQDDDTISESDGIVAMDHYLQAEIDYEAPDSSPFVEAAGFLVRHKWQPARALELLRKAQPLLAHEQELEARDDNRSADRQEMADRQAIYQRQEFNSFLLQAALQAGRPEEAKAVRASVEGPPPTQKNDESTYWLNRGRLAVLENRKADALTYYHLAFETRSSPPVPRRGRLYDPLNDDARALWKDLGGSEVAWNLWLKSKPNGQELVEGRWEKAKKQLPAFELADLAGKTWKLKNLEGKTLLINVWATWCPPCNAELPHLQELYEEVKDRPDVQILTFNVDETLGLVEPFVAKKGYTFPVLPAYSLVENILDGVAIPQNWVIDPQGHWRWTQLGFDGAPNWAKVVMEHVESVKMQ